MLDSTYYTPIKDGLAYHNAETIRFCERASCEPGVAAFDSDHCIHRSRSSQPQQKTNSRGLSRDCLVVLDSWNMPSSSPDMLGASTRRPREPFATVSSFMRPSASERLLPLASSYCQDGNASELLRASHHASSHRRRRQRRHISPTHALRILSQPS